MLIFSQDGFSSTCMHFSEKDGKYLYKIRTYPIPWVCVFYDNHEIFDPNRSYGKKFTSGAAGQTEIKQTDLFLNGKKIDTT